VLDNEPLNSARLSIHVRWGRRGTHKILVGKPEGKRPLGIPRSRWVDNIKKNIYFIMQPSGRYSKYSVVPLVV
jgi:hypothetical protein